MKHSESIAKLAAALVEAQKDFAPAIKSAINPQFKSKYVDLASAIEAAQPSLLKHGLAVLQGAAGDVVNQSISVTTRILHSSGEWVEDTLTLPAVNREAFTAQTAGSAITYARRYSYMAILGFAPEDDDGNAASQAPAPQPVVKMITAAQAEEFRRICGESGFSPDAVRKALSAAGIKSSAQIPAVEYKQWIEWAQKTAEVPA